MLARPRDALGCAVGRSGAGLETAIIAAAAKTSTSAMRSSRARGRPIRNTTEATATAIQASPPNPASRPPRKTRYVVVMSGSRAPIAAPEPSASATDSRNHLHHRASEPRRRPLNREGQCRALSHNLSKKGRAGGARELDRQILPNQSAISRDHDGLEIARPRLKQRTATR